ncbi:ABC transporter ATP-binding protein [Arthrobacter sp. FX8]|jgi:ABC-2 type transport system ATP-binding protein|uniref:ABC transporter ATP-binding protein n=1 Tax=Micrococcaceae TaxID=1268 RepID=UPI0003705CEB|nr:MULTISPECIES: ABC transporter ATP-binding protein [unclassified Arthrobacter]KRE67058.1 multidrug ABC transporter ATP-binding protein [Arthrobacter sp. Soil761]WAJ32809.1 ABC transporter ATP-binding protein [Arthrobacter sp. FX8]BCW56630.1 multidrug ABC transporter ATP-binding protein [Arthrobacter sp. StoSoilB19]BCW77735.1 multidrug ABC transporter ATP-binding protein [Arthrobacter sp. NicSoilB11]
MIEANGLTKVYGAKTAVAGVSFTVRAGQVTGFLGPNGAGKSTTMRMIMGLDRPTSGSVTVNGLPYVRHKAPLREVGALLDAKAVHTSRSAYNHLLAMAATHSIPKSRVHEVIEMTGLEAVARKKAGGFSLGMGQRLGIAAALLGDPQTLILDEPVNGLDPEGVVWVRNLVRYLAGQGRTVFLSSHLMSEMAQTADHLIVIGRGRVIADAPIRDIITGKGQARVRVRTDEPDRLYQLLAGRGASIDVPERELLEVTGLEPRTIAAAALENHVMVYELTPLVASLEEAYMELTKDDVEYHSLPAAEVSK